MQNTSATILLKTLRKSARYDSKTIELKRILCVRKILTKQSTRVKKVQ